MKLIQAFEILRNEERAHRQTLKVSLLCGFNPLHFQTLLAAELQLALPHQRPEVARGLYGDFWGNLEKIEGQNPDLAIVVMEWSDLDPRLGLRNLGSWAPDRFPDIVSNAKLHASQLLIHMDRAGREFPVVVCLPTLPLPPISFSASWEANPIELELRACISQLGLELDHVQNVRILNQGALDHLSPLCDRFDAKSELISGFPYKLSHASVLARLMVALVERRPSKKGLITDLDDTLWDGILGEVGCAGVSWDLANQSHMHGAYQRLLHALSESGVLVAVASKNEKRLVEEALERPDLMLPRDVLYPIEAHWRPKSESVGHILKTWNIGPDAAVFVDDSAMELAEVKATHPDVECILFPKNNPQAICDLFQRLRDLFGKSTISDEDRIRRESIRKSKINLKDDGKYGFVSSEFLAQVEAEMTYDCSKEPVDPRALELVNKTNQFNLNGKRYSEAEWQRYIKGPDKVLMIVAYKDKYGPLGKIAVLAGRMEDETFFLDTWVMSCRAFARRIEHRSLEELFELTKARMIAFNYKPTAKNGPLRDCLAQLLGAAPDEGCVLSKERFEEMHGMGFPPVLETSNG